MPQHTTASLNRQPIPKKNYGPAGAVKVLAGCFALTLLVVAGLYRAGGFQPYSVAPGYHYGINSPLEALLLLCPPEIRVLGDQYFLILRSVLAAVALCWYLQRHFGRTSWLLAPLSAAYGTGVYTACIINLAWVDAALLLPLLMDTVDRLIETGRFRRLGLLVFLCVLMNCYTAWPLIIFGYVYLVWQCFIRPGPADWACWRRGSLAYLKGAVPGTLGALLCLAPLLYSYLKSGAFRIILDTHPMAFDFQEVFYCLVYGRYSLSAAGQGMPYLYSSMTAVALGVLYFLNKAGTREKFISVFTLVGLGATYLIELPGICWQNGDDVTVFPFRYGFIFSAVLLVFAANTILNGPPPALSIGASLLFSGIWLLGYRQQIGPAYSSGKFLAAVMLYLGACFCIWLRANRPGRRRFATAALGLLLLADVYASSCITLYGALH